MWIAVAMVQGAAVALALIVSFAFVFGIYIGLELHKFLKLDKRK